MTLHLGHRCLQLPGLQELGHQDAQAVLVRELRREDLKDGLAGRTAAAGATLRLGGAVRVQDGPDPGQGWERGRGDKSPTPGYVLWLSGYEP